MAKGIKTGGRHAGTPNKERKTLLELLSDKFPEYHPVIALAEIANKSKNEVLRFQANKEVAKYVCPQLKSIELKADEVVDIPITDFSGFNREQLIELVKGYAKGQPEPLIIDDINIDPNVAKE